MMDPVIMSSSLNNSAKDSVGCCQFVSLLVPHYIYLFMFHLTTMILAQTIPWGIIGSSLNNH
jgi:hypothetical protein